MLQNQDRHHDLNHAPGEIESRERYGQAAQRLVIPCVHEPQPRVTQKVSGRGHIRARVRRSQHDHRRKRVGHRDSDQGDFEPYDLGHDGAHGSANDSRKDPAVGVEGVDSFPERLWDHERKEAAQAAAAQGARECRHGHDPDEQQRREVAGERQPRDQEQGHRDDDVVDDDQADPAVAVEQGAGNRAYEQARNDAGKGHEPGQRWIVEALQSKQNHDQADHRLGDSGDLHREQNAAQGRDGEQSSVRRASHDGLGQGRRTWLRG